MPYEKHRSHCRLALGKNRNTDKVSHIDRKEHQTWCATGYISLWLYQVFGINPAIDHLTLNPMGMQDGSECTLSGFHWRGCDITITVRGRIKHRSTPEVYLNGVKQAEKEIIIIPNQGSLHYEIMFGNL